MTVRLSLPLWPKLSSTPFRNQINRIPPKQHNNHYLLTSPGLSSLNSHSQSHDDKATLRVMLLMM